MNIINCIYGITTHISAPPRKSRGIIFRKNVIQSIYVHIQAEVTWKKIKLVNDLSSSNTGNGTP